MTAPPTPIREYDVAARTTDIFGRILCSARIHHFVADGPVQNNCPGEALTPPELFLSAVASCGVELVEVIARETGVRIKSASVLVHAMLDRSRQARTEVTVFNSVRMDFTITGTDQESATGLVDGFRKRCPIYGTMAVAVGEMTVTVKTA
jgi:uncharacterized OsmC-like protein